MTVQPLSIGFETLLNGSPPAEGTGRGMEFAAILSTFLSGEGKGDAAASGIGQPFPENTQFPLPWLKSGMGETALPPEARGENPADMLIIPADRILSEDTADIVLNISAPDGSSHSLRATLSPDLTGQIRVAETAEGERLIEIPVRLGVKIPSITTEWGSELPASPGEILSDTPASIEALLVLSDSQGEEERAAEIILALTPDPGNIPAQHAVHALFPGFIAGTTESGESGRTLSVEDPAPALGNGMNQAVSPTAAPQGDFSADESHVRKDGAVNPAPEAEQPPREILSERTGAAFFGEISPAAGGTGHTRQSGSSTRHPEQSFSPETVTLNSVSEAQFTGRAGDSPAGQTVFPVPHPSAADAANTEHLASSEGDNHLRSLALLLEQYMGKSGEMLHLTVEIRSGEGSSAPSGSGPSETGGASGSPLAATGKEATEGVSANAAIHAESERSDAFNAERDPALPIDQDSPVVPEGKAADSGNRKEMTPSGAGPDTPEPPAGSEKGAEVPRGAPGPNFPERREPSGAVFTPVSGEEEIHPVRQRSSAPDRNTPSSPEHMNRPEGMPRGEGVSRAHFRLSPDSGTVLTGSEFPPRDTLESAPGGWTASRPGQGTPAVETAPQNDTLSAEASWSPGKPLEITRSRGTAVVQPVDVTEEEQVSPPSGKPGSTAESFSGISHGENTPSPEKTGAVAAQPDGASPLAASESGGTAYHHPATGFPDHIERTLRRLERTLRDFHVTEQKGEPVNPEFIPKETGAAKPVYEMNGIEKRVAGKGIPAEPVSEGNEFRGLPESGYSSRSESAEAIETGNRNIRSIRRETGAFPELSETGEMPYREMMAGTGRREGTLHPAPEIAAKKTAAPYTRPESVEQGELPTDTVTPTPVGDTAAPELMTPEQTVESEGTVSSEHGQVRDRLTYGNGESLKKGVEQSGIARLNSPDDAPPLTSGDTRSREPRERTVSMEGGGNAPSPINPDNPMPGEHGAAGLDERFETAVRSRKASRTENHRTERSSASIPAAVSENNAGSETEGSGSNPGRLATRGSTFLFAGEEAPLTGQNPGFDEILASNGSETEGESPGEVIPARFDTERGSRISGTSRGEPVHGYRGSPDGSMLEANILNAIVRHARLMLGNGQSSATIVLEPPRLGKLKLEIVTENAKVAGKILVESKEVQDIIRNNLPELRQNLLQNGLQVESFDVQVGHNGGTDNWAQRENMESTAALFRVERVRARENGGDSAAPAQTRSRNTARSPGYLDVWM